MNFSQLNSHHLSTRKCREKVLPPFSVDFAPDDGEKIMKKISMTFLRNRIRTFIVKLIAFFALSS